MTGQKSAAELAAESSSEDTRSFVRRVKRATRRKYTPEEKVRIVLEGFRGEIGITALCRRGYPPHSLLRLAEGLHGGREVAAAGGQCP